MNRIVVFFKFIRFSLILNHKLLLWLIAVFYQGLNCSKQKNIENKKTRGRIELDMPTMRNILLLFVISDSILVSKYVSFAPYLSCDNLSSRRRTHYTKYENSSSLARQ